MKISVDIEIESPKSEVWAAITNIENSANMISAILALDVLHQPEQGMIGLKWKETREVFGKESSETMWITECEDEAYYCTRAESHGAIYMTKLSVSETDGKTLLTMEFSGRAESFVAKVLSAMMSPFMKGSMEKMLQRDLEDIKRFVESGQSNR